ncbi:transmembrane protein 223-like [Nylanderia fulva]|uniref:transmembrane protein 223-like n=1 Tax=Nylanderia fulva TaxID=613905 RepID=UPI0010FB656C|nr:transmembrane protein 223-like [Nylanderia fulva]
MFGLVLKHPIIFKALLTEAQSTCGMIHKCFIYDKNIFLSASTVRTFLTQSIRSFDGLRQPVSFLKPNKSPQSLIVRHQQEIKTILDVNTNVRNNVLLYKNESNRHFWNIRLFAFGQLFGWSILALYTYTPKFFDIFKTDVKIKEFLQKHFIRFGTFVFSIFAGPITFGVMYATCSRNIKYIILNKGGKTLSLFTYHLCKRKLNTITVPIGMAKCTSPRTGVTGVCIPLKVKNKSFYYLIDKSGTFVNPTLFDYTTAN